ncbi:MAG TPA: hypothetical protein PKM65_18605 [Spirochaetota bacterium]|nr:hypothetical protein [Spirochaetota bacterium]HNT13034.1 hypothetical protein [Spirochaetota bacterium]HNV47319.1 hypothetical protein [Spirochaetota bacterium]HOS39851.1 hypothetical protein [Spirochaetota bacterium]HPI21913.1 hypothetical protein [Spirochaetota bacterium]
MANGNGAPTGLIDFYLDLEDDPEYTGKTGEIFRKILTDYFFGFETDANKSFALMLGNFEAPDFIAAADSLFNLDLDAFADWINGETLNTSLGGRIMLNPKYLKYAYPHHPPEYNKLPPNVQVELFDRIKKKNREFIDAFHGMMADRAADRGRTILALVAMILREVHKKTEMPLNRLTQKADAVIRTSFEYCDEIFRASQKQMTELGDDSKVRACIKTFFPVKRAQEIAEIGGVFKQELERMKRRTLRAQQ